MERNINLEKINEIVKFIDENQHKVNDDYAMLTQLRSTLYFVDKSLEKKQKDLEEASEKLKSLFSVIIAPDKEEDDKIAEVVSSDKPSA